MSDKQQPVRKHLEGLMDEPPINFYPSLARRTGPNKALILQEIHFTCSLKRRDQSEFGHHDGRWWVYNTYENWVERYFPWLSVGALKRIFQELEICGILLSRPYENDQRTKWYAVNSEGWDEWFAKTPKDDRATIEAYKKRIKSIRNNGSKESASDEKADQNDPQKPDQIDPILIPKADQNDPVSTPEADQNDPQLPIYKESEDSLTEDSDSKPTEDSIPEDSSTSTEVAGELTADPTTPPPDDDDDEVKNLILPEVKKLQFPQNLQVKLLARGYDYALATAKAAQNGKNPGGLARHMMNNGGPPVELIEWARKAIELRTLDQAAIDNALRVHTAGVDVDMSRPDEPPNESLNHILPDGETVWNRCRDALWGVVSDPRFNGENTLRALAALDIYRYNEMDGDLFVTGTQQAVQAFEHHLNMLKSEKITVRCFVYEDA